MKLPTRMRKLAERASARKAKAPPTRVKVRTRAAAGAAVPTLLACAGGCCWGGVGQLGVRLCPPCCSRAGVPAVVLGGHAPLSPDASPPHPHPLAAVLLDLQPGGGGPQLSGPWLYRRVGLTAADPLQPAPTPPPCPPPPLLPHLIPLSHPTLLGPAKPPPLVSI